MNERKLCVSLQPPSPPPIYQFRIMYTWYRNDDDDDDDGKEGKNYDSRNKVKTKKNNKNKNNNNVMNKKERKRCGKEKLENDERK